MTFLVNLTSVKQNTRFRIQRFGLVNYLPAVENVCKPFHLHNSISSSVKWEMISTLLLLHLSCEAQGRSSTLKTKQQGGVNGYIFIFRNKLILNQEHLYFWSASSTNATRWTQQARPPTHLPVYCLSTFFPLTLEITLTPVNLKRWNSVAVQAPCLNCPQ